MRESAVKVSPTNGSDIPHREAYEVPEVAALIGVSERYAWKLVGSGDLKSFKTGRLRKVARKDLDAWIDRLREDEERVRQEATPT
ncbi:MAG: helix-turn-helix domain-containing protein [Anaerolineae bacterium]|nr:helix-turn-helix domain-containing protein [Anaerolineae bacterium]